MKKDNFTIGILGGMGTYATINLFRQYAEIFEASKEWERPRIIIDNRCTMPSRVRAFLYKENVDELINQMADSIRNIMNMCGGDVRIILACNTSHLFLPQIYKLVPEAKNKVVDLIFNCVNQIKLDNNKEIYILGSEGTIESGIYNKELEKNGIMCQIPEKEEYIILRECIEAVKQNKFSADIEDKFNMLMSKSDTILLGCTELPILYQMYREHIKSKKIYDPVLLVLKKLREEYNNLN